MSCVSCSGGGENDCLSCNNSLYIENGRCVNQCSIGFYQNNDSHTCDSCPNVCLACSSRILPFSSFSFFSFYLIFFWKNNKLICAHHVFQIILCMEENVCINVLMDLVQTMPFVLVSFSSSFFSFIFMLIFFSSLENHRNWRSNSESRYSLIWFYCYQFRELKGTINQWNKWIVGLGVGLTFGLVFLILLAILVLLFIKRQKKKQMEKFSEISMVFFFFFFSFSLFLLLTNFFFRITLGKKG